MVAWQDIWQRKLLAPETIAESVAALRAKGLTVATLNGSFDLLHAGHLYILHEAAQVANCLIVALNSDSSIRSYKGPDRPIIDLSNRMQMIAAIEGVDYVTWFEETTPCDLLAKIKPDVHVNGAEYGLDCVEAAIVRSNGGRLHLVERLPGLATSHILAKIQTLQIVEAT